MMGFLLLQPGSAHICMLGFGGGSLAKYCYRHLPGATIDAVEINPDVIALRDVFRIPVDDGRFTVVCADGADHLGRADVRTDVILHDAFVADGMRGRCTGAAFLAACHARLSENGVLAINFMDDDPALPEHLEQLRSVFGASIRWRRAATTTTSSRSHGRVAAGCRRCGSCSNAHLRVRGPASSSWRPRRGG